MNDYVAKVDFVNVGRTSLDLVGCFRTFEILPSHRGVLAFITGLSSIDHAMNPCRLSFEIMTTHAYTLGVEGGLKEQFEHAVEVHRAVYFAIIHTLNLQHLIGSDGTTAIQVSAKQLLDVKDLIDKLEVVAMHHNELLASGSIEGNFRLTEETVYSGPTAYGTKKFLSKLCSNRDINDQARTNENSFNQWLEDGRFKLEGTKRVKTLFCRLNSEHLVFQKKYQDWLNAKQSEPKKKPTKRTRTGSA